MNTEKTEFLRIRLVPLLRQIPTETKPAWGKMTLQQMVEHFTDAVRIASGRTVHTEIVTPPEQLPRYRDFIMSEKPFRENTVNPLMPELPAPVINTSLKEALDELEEEISLFFEVFEKNKLQQTRNPIFGDLDFEQNVHLLYKHGLHHLRQFGVSV
jgi:hypothetical protein